MKFYSGVSMKNLLKLFLLMLLILTTNSFAQSHNKWYISPSGSGDQSGTSRSNAKIFTSINALNIQPGDTVFVVEGNYIGQLYFRKNGTANALITIMPDPQNTGEAVFRNTDGYAIDIKGQSYIRLKKLTIRNSKGGVVLGTGKVKFLDSLHISKNAGTGINLYGYDGGEYNPNYNPGTDSNVDSVFIRWSYIATDTQVTVQTDCITIYWAHGVRILNNYILQGNYTGTGHNDVIQTDHGIGDIYIANNVLINLKENNSQIIMGGNSWAGYNTVIYNNVTVHYGAGTGIWQYRAYNGYNPNNAFADLKDGEVYVINNTLIGRRQPIQVYMSPLNLDFGTGLNYDSVYILNNLFYQIQSDGTEPLNLPRKATDPHPAMYSNANILAIPNGVSDKHVGTWFSGAYTGRYTLSQWKSLSPFDSASTTSLPTFRNFTYTANFDNYQFNEDVRLATGSVGIDMGKNLIKIKGNQWITAKSLIESFGLQWESFNNPYVSWSSPVPRSQTAPTIGAVEFFEGSGGNNQPNQPTSPNPPSGSANQPTSLTLSWNCSDPDGDPLSYDIYFGTINNPPLVAQNHQSTSYNINNLTSGVTYFWRIVAKDNHGGISSGELWSFATSTLDTTSPRLLSASLIDNVTLSLTFSEQLDPSTVSQINNYSITNGIAVNSALLNGVTVRLITSEHTPGFYNITVNNIKDVAGNTISPSFNSASYGYNPDTLSSMLKFIPFNANASSAPDTSLNPFKTFDGLDANSGDPNTRWAAPGLPQWIGYDLGDLKMLNKIRIQFYRWERIYTYSVQVSTDSLIWTDILSNVVSQQTAWSEVSFDPVAARYVRIIVHYNSAQINWASIWEAEFYGNLIISGNDDLANVPKEFKLEQNYPNPFNPTTKIRYSIPRSTEYYSVQQKVTLKVYDILGNEIATLVDDYKSAGNYEVDFNASDIASGIYIYRLFVQDLQTKDGKNGVYTESKKMLLMR